MTIPIAGREEGGGGGAGTRVVSFNSGVPVSCHDPGLVLWSETVIGKWSQWLLWRTAKLTSRIRVPTEDATYESEETKHES